MHLDCTLTLFDGFGSKLNNRRFLELDEWLSTLRIVFWTVKEDWSICDSLKFKIFDQFKGLCLNNVRFFKLKAQRFEIPFKLINAALKCS